MEDVAFLKATHGVRTGLLTTTQFPEDDVSATINSLLRSSALTLGRERSFGAQVSSERILQLYFPPEHERKSNAGLQSVLRNKDLPLGLQLIKLVVFFCANNLPTTYEDQIFDVLQDLSSDVDAVERLLTILADNNLYWVFEKILDMYAPAAKAFAGRALICAAQMGDHQLVHDILQRSPPLNEAIQIEVKFWSGAMKTINGIALHVAVLKQDLKLIRLLLDAGFDPNGHVDIHTIDSSCSIPPWLALGTPLGTFLAERGRVAGSDLGLIKVLLQAPNVKHSIHCDIQWWNAMAQIAIDHSCVEVVELILKDYDHLDKASSLQDDKLLKLIFALWSNDLGTAKFLLQQDLNFNEHFCSRRLTAQLTFVYDKDPPNSLSEFEMHLFRLAIITGDVELVQLLLDRHLEDWTSHPEAKRICVEAMDHGGCAMISLLLETGLEINNPKLSLLGSAACLGRLDLVRLLLQRGADARLRPCEFDKSPVQAAISTKRREVAELLMAYTQPNCLEEANTLHDALRDNISSPKFSFSFLQSIVEAISRGLAIPIFSVVELMIKRYPASSIVILNEFGIDWVTWAFANGVRSSTLLASLDEKLDCYQDIDWRKTTFNASTDILETLLDSGIHPGRSLLKLCATSCSSYAADNLRFLVGRRRLGGFPLSIAEMTTLVQDVIQFLHKLDYHFFKYCYKHHMSVILELIDYGVLVEDEWIKCIL